VCIITHKAENEVHLELVGVTPQVRVVVATSIFAISAISAISVNLPEIRYRHGR
jgi:hypothetical protein